MEQPTLLSYGGESTLMPESPQSMASPSRQSSKRACAKCVKAKAKCMGHSESRESASGNLLSLGRSSLQYSS